MNAENKRKKIKRKKRSSPSRTLLFFSFVLFSCLLLIVFSSIFISKDVEQSKDKQEDTVLYEEQKSRTGLSEEDMQESSVPQVEKDIDRSQVLAESSVPQKKTWEHYSCS